MGSSSSTYEEGPCAPQTQVIMDGKDTLVTINADLLGDKVA